MNSLLPLDIYRYLPTVTHFRLRDIINLMTVSKNLHRVSLLEENWYVIADTKKILYNFIRRIFQSESVPYPYNKIRRMYTIDYYDEIIYPEIPGNLLPIIPKRGRDMDKFYKYFTDYQYCHVNYNFNMPDHINKSFVGVYGDIAFYIEFFRTISHQNNILKYTISHITEIFAPSNTIDCVSLVKFFPQIEKLDVYNIQNSHPLKQTKLKYLRISRNVETDEIISYLPNTIESLIILNGKTPSYERSLDQLSKYPCLNYLKINIRTSLLSTPLNINTVHFILDWAGCSAVDLKIPNIKHIIITNRYYNQIYLTSQCAITCRILNIDRCYLVTVLPKCPEIIFRNDSMGIDFNSEIF
jgi:hypothetical protein